MAEHHIHAPTAPAATDAAVSSTKLIATLSVLGLLCGILIVLAYRSTYAPIAANKARFLERAIFEVLPHTTRKITYAVTGDTLRPLADGEQAEAEVYAGYDAEHHLTGIAVPTEGQGFADVLSILYGYAPVCHCIVGMKVLESRETPGLGDKIETDPVFRANFAALSVELAQDKNAIRNPIILVKHGKKTNPWEIDAISGATISSRAVANMLTKSTATIIPVLEKNLSLLERGDSNE